VTDEAIGEGCLEARGGVGRGTVDAKLTGLKVTKDDLLLSTVEGWPAVKDVQESKEGGSKVKAGAKGDNVAGEVARDPSQRHHRLDQRRGRRTVITSA
jgi:hypothetical protein